MYMEVLVCALLHLAAICNVSVLSAPYLLTGLVQTVWLVARPHAPVCLYVLLCIYATLCLSAKLVFTGLFFSHTPFLDGGDMRELLGFLVSSREHYAYDLFLTLFPDALSLALSVLGLRAARGAKPQSWGKPWLWLFLTFGSICVNSVFACAALNLCYLLLCLTWGAVSTRRVPQHSYKWLCLSALTLAVLHVDFSFCFDAVLKEELWTDARRQLGALWFNRLHIGEVALVLVTLYLALCASRALLLASPEDLLRPLNPFELVRPRATHAPHSSEEGTELRESMAESKDAPVLERRKSFLRLAWNTLNSSQTLFLSFKFLLAFWITHYCSWLGVAQLLWLFYCVLEPLRHRAIWSLGWMMLPLLAAQSVAAFVVNILESQVSDSVGVQVFSTPWAEFAFQLLTLHVGFASVLLSTIEERTLYHGTLSTQPCVSLVLENADKLSLCAVFAIGLSAINLLHAGLMVICMVFMLNTQLAKRYWNMLVGYTMFLLLLRYVWVLSAREDSHLLDNSTTLNLVGLPTDTSEMVYPVLPEDYLVWILLAAGSMQLSAYRSLGQRGRTANTGGCFTWVLKTALRMYEFLKNDYIWPVYGLLFLIMLVSDLNLLNAVRYLLLLGMLVLHLKGKRKPISVGLGMVKRVWFVFVYYSGGLMSFRYMYQFSQFSHDYGSSEGEKWMEYLGIKRYSSGQLYAAMVGDTVILLAAVLTARSFHSQNWMDQGDNTANGLLLGYLRQETHEHTESFKLMKYLAGPFDKLLVFTIGLLAVYWKLAASTALLLLLCLYFFYVRITYHYHDAKRGRSVHSNTLDARYKQWELLFVSTIGCAALDYFAFAVPTEWLWQWTASVAGFSNRGLKLSEIWGYALVLILLTVEKHCIEFLKQQSESEHTVSQYWMSARVVAEEAIVLCLLLLAFTKLTVVSFIYVGAVVLFTLSRQKLLYMWVLGVTLACSMALQYLVLLSNVQPESAPQTLPTTHPQYVPWYPHLHLNSPEVQFFNLGPDLTQLHSLSADLLVLLLTLTYFQHLAGAQTAEDQVQVAGLETTKSFVYNFAHVVILVLVLVFVSQSAGLSAVVYCVFCLVFLFKANQLLRSEKGWASYIHILRRYFTGFMLLDFCLNMVYQVPLAIFDNSDTEDWGRALGLVRLWRSSGSQPSDAREQYMWIVYKTLTFALVQLIIRMFEHSDFKSFMADFRAKAQARAEEVSRAMAHSFNDGRIAASERYRQDKADLDLKLSKLDAQVKSWHDKQQQVLDETFAPESASINSEPLVVQSKVSLRHRLWLGIVGLANPYLFREVVERARGPGKLSWRSGGWLAFAVLSSNTHLICYFCFILNGLVYASLEALVFPLSMLSYALLEAPRPLPRYWRLMLAYSEVVFFVKFVLHLNFWELLNNPLQYYHDTYKIGFLDPTYSYTPSIFAYTVCDVLCMLAILAHEYYLLRCGLGRCTEFELETLNQAKARLQGAGEAPFQEAELLPVERSSYWRKFIAFLTRVSPKVKEEKPGSDLYTPALLVQLILLFYILFFYTQMDGESQVFSGAFASSQFSGHMVVALLLQTALVLLDRYLYLCSTSQSTRKAEESVPRRSNSLSWRSYFATKCVLYWLLVFFMHAMVFWYYPLSGNYLRRPPYYDCSSLHSSECKNFQVNSALQWFYLLYLLYFLLSAAQLRLGMPSYRAGSMPLTRIDNDAARYTFQGYMGLPFFFELRTMVDWSFTKTSLDMFQWFKFEEIYSQLYISKVLLRGYYSRPRGEPIGVCEKFCIGVCGLFLTLVLILGPLIIFSSLNPIVEDNLVNSASVEVGAMINESYYLLYSAERVQSLSKLNSHSKLFDSTTDVTTNERENAQTIVMPNSSDTLWAVPAVTKAELMYGLGNASLPASSTSAALSMSYTFTREVSPS